MRAGIVHAFQCPYDQLMQFRLTQRKFSVAAIETHQKFWEHKHG
jgi:hypothetical protein